TPCSGSGRPPTRPAAPRRRPGLTPAPATPPRRPRPSDETPTRNPTPPRRTTPRLSPCWPSIHPGRLKPAPAAPPTPPSPRRSPSKLCGPLGRTPIPRRSQLRSRHPGALRRPAPQRPARPRLRTRTRTPWIRPGNPASAPDGPGDPYGSEPRASARQRRFLVGCTPPKASLFDRSIAESFERESSQSSRGRRFRIGCAELRKRRSRSGFQPFPLCAREPAFLPEATGTSMSRSRLLTELFDSRLYISATDTPGLALAPGTCGLPLAITARFPTEWFKEDGMMLKKVNGIP